ncbi:hypothetical protein Niako_2779 [Niastella koreensis GR20-10]|uniref:Uncharacterized protein n=1 Tax=Niastella koreensis (strain DSM 17620 / KACC 11465 / NBRC 106392 / GR20-10) TaxID=700598 RepID=G8T8E3_NIAKG|nr:hypothetical protein Niako_2779 [Niastella koreensis GR20-10]
MDQQPSHTKYLDHLQGEWIKDTRILRMFPGGAVVVEEGTVHQGDNRPPFFAA